MCARVRIRGPLVVSPEGYFFECRHAESKPTIVAKLLRSRRNQGNENQQEDRKRSLYLLSAPAQVLEEQNELQSIEIPN